jgi:hypothetical protein
LIDGHLECGETAPTFATQLRFDAATPMESAMPGPGDPTADPNWNPQVEAYPLKRRIVGRDRARHVDGAFVDSSKVDSQHSR